MTPQEDNENDPEKEEREMQTMLDLHLEFLLEEYPELQEVPRDLAFAIFAHGFMYGAKYMREMIAEEIVNEVLESLEDPNFLKTFPTEPPLSKKKPKTPKKNSKKPKKPNS